VYVAVSMCVHWYIVGLASAPKLALQAYTASVLYAAVFAMAISPANAEADR
jgi:hypothetical protein